MNSQRVRVGKQIAGHLFAGLAVWLLRLPAAFAQPQPGDVFREYKYSHDTIIEADPASTQANPKFKKRQAISMRERSLDIWDLGDATRAEIALELWGGHAGTSGHSVRVNGGTWQGIPQIRGTPTDPHCYQRMQLGSAVVPISVEALKLGRNLFQFRAGKQICHDFNWGIFKIYAFTVRIYYGPGKPRPDGKVIVANHITDNPTLSAKAQGAPANLQKIEFTASSPLRVDFVAKYEDFNWEGDGVFTQWHGVTEQGELKRHIGTALSPPWQVKWNTQWIPDQTVPIELAARITSTHGLIYMTQAVSVQLERKTRSVRMFRASEVPEKFGARDGSTKSCTIEVQGAVGQARAARLVLSTWAGAHADAIGLNEKKIVDRVGAEDYFSLDAIDFSPKGIVRQGKNTFFVSSNTQAHHAEVNWPGPVLLLEFPVSKPRP